MPLKIGELLLKARLISDDQLEYAEQIAATLRENDFRVSVDSRSERVGAKIRLARNERVPYMMILGGDEVQNSTVSLRGRDGEQNVMTLDDVIEKLKRENSEKLKS